MSMRSTATLEYSTVIEIDSGNLNHRHMEFFSRSILSMVSILFFKYQVFRYDRFREPRIDFIHLYNLGLRNETI